MPRSTSLSDDQSIQLAFTRQVTLIRALLSMELGAHSTRSRETAPGAHRDPRATASGGRRLVELFTRAMSERHTAEADLTWLTATWDRPGMSCLSARPRGEAGTPQLSSLCCTTCERPGRCFVNESWLPCVTHSGCGLTCESGRFRRSAQVWAMLSVFGPTRPWPTGTMPAGHDFCALTAWRRPGRVS